MGDQKPRRFGCLSWAILAAFLFFMVMVVIPAWMTETKAMYTGLGMRVYNEARERASEGDLATAARSLQSVVETDMPKVSPESRFGYILEMYRASTIREIIARMRTLSGEDLGDDPEAWIQNYCGTLTGTAQPVDGGQPSTGRAVSSDEP